MKKPIHTSTPTFRRLIEGGYVYVDKTRDIYDLVRELGGIYFLSRPRRFGKSLLISTLDEIFQGNKELFEGLWISESDYQWATHPIIRVDFSTKQVRSAEELEDAIQTYLRRVAETYGINYAEDRFIQLDDLIWSLTKITLEEPSSNQVVILVDEYDKPLVDNLHNLEEAKRIRDVMKGFYAGIKALDQHIRFVFITGISKFSKVSIFSELNHLTDLTMRPAFATLLGLTEQELRDNFAEYIADFAQEEGMSDEEFLAEMRHWYNGFCFAPNAQNVYNPYSTAQLFSVRVFDNYWFESGTPTFLINLLHQQNYPVEELNHLKRRKIAFDTFDLKNLSVVPLLFQTGYLTIKGYEKRDRLFTLDYPNYEVEEAFLTYLLDVFGYLEKGDSAVYILDLIQALKDDDIDLVFQIMKVLFANIDYDLHLDYEKYYQTIFYLTFKLIGVNINAEVKTDKGRIDAVIHLDDRIYLFEFKLDKTADEALQQIKTDQYYQKYLGQRKPIILIGANFSTETKTVDDWKVER
ncbi:MAG: AAA family ATPase [Chloroflexota bacterium]